MKHGCGRRNLRFVCTHTQIDKWKNVNPSTSFDVDLKVSCGNSSLPLETGPPCATWRLRADYGAALELDTKAHKYPSAA